MTIPLSVVARLGVIAVFLPLAAPVLAEDDEGIGRR